MTLLSFTHVRYYAEAVIQKCSVKEVFLKISQNLQENTCVNDSFIIKLQVISGEFCQIFKNNSFYRTSLVAASDYKG